MKGSHGTGSAEESHEESSAGAETAESKDLQDIHPVESFFARQNILYTSPVCPPDADAYNEDKVRLL